MCTRPAGPRKEHPSDRRALALKVTKTGRRTCKKALVVCAEHDLLMLAAHYAGVPIAPLAEQYSLIPQASSRLDHCIQKIKPALVFADDGNKFGKALNRDSLASVSKRVSTNIGSGEEKFASMLKGVDCKALTEA